MFVCTHNTSAPMEMHAHVLIWGFKATYLKQRSSYVQWDKATRMQIIWASLRLSQKAARKWNYTLKRSEGNYNLIVSNYGNDGHDIFFHSLSFQFVFALKLYSWPKIDLFYLLMARFLFLFFLLSLCSVLPQWQSFEHKWWQYLHADINKHIWLSQKSRCIHYAHTVVGLLCTWGY